MDGILWDSFFASKLDGLRSQDNRATETLPPLGPGQRRLDETERRRERGGHGRSQVGADSWVEMVLPMGYAP